MFLPNTAAIDPVVPAGQAVTAREGCDDEGPYSPQMTGQALETLGGCVTYLRTCLGPAQTAAIPDSATLADVLLGLHIACTQLHAALQPALRGIDRRQWPADQQHLPIAQVAALRAAVAGARNALHIAATQFATAHHAATPAAGARTTAEAHGCRKIRRHRHRHRLRPRPAPGRRCAPAARRAHGPVGCRAGNLTCQATPTCGPAGHRTRPTIPASGGRCCATSTGLPPPSPTATARRTVRPRIRPRGTPNSSTASGSPPPGCTCPASRSGPKTTAWWRRCCAATPPG